MKNKFLLGVVAFVLCITLFSGCAMLDQIAKETKDRWWSYYFTYDNNNVKTDLEVYIYYSDADLTPIEGIRDDVEILKGLNILIVPYANGSNTTGALLEALSDDKFILKNYPLNGTIEGEGTTKTFKVTDKTWALAYTGLNGTGHLKREPGIPYQLEERAKNKYSPIEDLESIKDSFSIKGLVRQMLFDFLEE